jgi:hypothetical protein
MILPVAGSPYGTKATMTTRNPLTKTSSTLEPLLSVRLRTPITKNIAATVMATNPTKRTNPFRSFSRLEI